MQALLLTGRTGGGTTGVFMKVTWVGKACGEGESFNLAILSALRIFCRINFLEPWFLTLSLFLLSSQA